VNNGCFSPFFSVSFRRAKTAISEGEQVFPAVFIREGSDTHGTVEFNDQAVRASNLDPVS
jgi:hypothetical protein